MAPTAGHRNKRQINQAAITSFFHADSSDAEASQPGQNHDREALSPALPHNVQSSLLNVGMRVRKSVPEGYKNKAVVEEIVPIASSRRVTRGRWTELQSFCGIHKTGGLESQLIGYHPADEGGVAPVGAQDIFPSSVFSSQDMLGSQQSYDGDGLRALQSVNFGSSNKRALVDEDEEEDGLDDDTLLDDMDTSVTQRVFAQPKGRGRLKENHRMSAIGGFNSVDDGFDFGEADFLRPVQGEEMEL